MSKIAKIEEKRVPEESKSLERGGGVLAPLTMFDEMDRMFDRFFGRLAPRGWMRPFHLQWPMLGELPGGLELGGPRVDIIDRDDELVLRAELPGVEKKDLDVSLTDTSVTIRGTTKHEEKEERGDYHRMERYHGEFARSIALPTHVEGDKAKATFENGVLEITLPKVEKTKRRTIKVE